MIEVLVASAGAFVGGLLTGRLSARADNEKRARTVEEDRLKTEEHLAASKRANKIKLEHIRGLEERLDLQDADLSASAAKIEELEIKVKELTPKPKRKYTRRKKVAAKK